MERGRCSGREVQGKPRTRELPEGEAPHSEDGGTEGREGREVAETVGDSARGGGVAGWRAAGREGSALWLQVGELIDFV